MNLTDSPDQSNPGPDPPRRRLRAVFAADIANFGGLMTTDETLTVDALSMTRRLAKEEFATHGGWLFGMPGDGIFALFESAVNAVRCALSIQSRLAGSPRLCAIKLRIGVHLGEVLFQDELPYGEALVIASRLEGLAEPGGILVSAPVMDAVASHIAATFVEGGVRTLKHSPRRIETFHVLPPPASESRPAADPLDRTVAPQRSQPGEPAPRRDLGDETIIVRRPRATPHVPPTEALAKGKSPPAGAPRSSAPVSSKDASSPPSESREKIESREKTEARAKTRSPGAATAGLDEASLNQLAHLLANHLGPIARLLVRRMAAANPGAAQLVRALAQEIPNEGERSNFLARAKALLAGPH